MTDTTPQLRFRDGTAMPAQGLGTWQVEPAAVGPMLSTALRLGYRHIDAAAIYGNESAIGAALARALGSGDVTREQLWITSKLWNDAHDPAQVRPALERTLRDLRLDWLDLYLIHWPVAHRSGVTMPSSGADQLSLEQQPLADTWGAMEELVEAGLVRHIGVSNFSIAKLTALAAAVRITPQVNQVERHPWLQQHALLRYCCNHGIVLTAYAPLGRAASAAGGSLLADPVITAIAAAHRATPAQVLLAWGLACGTAVIPKSVHPERLAANLAASRLCLSPEDLVAIRALDRHHRLVDGSFWVLPDGPYTLTNLWDEVAA
jgi:alcohol dehydrogenase (NADP+)